MACSQCAKLPLGTVGTQGKRTHRARITASVPFTLFGPGGKESPRVSKKKSNDEKVIHLYKVTVLGDPVIFSVFNFGEEQ